MSDRTQRSFERLILVSNRPDDRIFWETALSLYNAGLVPVDQNRSSLEAKERAWAKGESE